MSDNPLNGIQDVTKPRRLRVAIGAMVRVLWPWGVAGAAISLLAGLGLMINSGGRESGVYVSSILSLLFGLVLAGGVALNLVVGTILLWRFPSSFGVEGFFTIYSAIGVVTALAVRALAHNDKEVPIQFLMAAVIGLIGGVGLGLLSMFIVIPRAVKDPALVALLAPRH